MAINNTTAVVEKTESLFDVVEKSREVIDQLRQAVSLGDKVLISKLTNERNELSEKIADIILAPKVDGVTFVVAPN